MRAAGRRRSGFAAAAVLLAVLAAPSSAAADSGPAGSEIYGIHEPNSWYGGPNVVTSDQVAAEISKLRAGSHRFPVSWQEVERLSPLLGQHVYNFARYDLMYLSLIHI